MNIFTVMFLKANALAAQWRGLYMESLFEDLDYCCDKRIMFSNGFDQILQCVRIITPCTFFFVVYPLGKGLPFHCSRGFWFCFYMVRMKIGQTKLCLYKTKGETKISIPLKSEGASLNVSLGLTLNKYS